ncbi:MAG: polyphosphate kinase 1 [Gammaproteobacteria bacterium]|nr:MAG: polyphosphate kinase 1 [Gammaproteobacteria bacterium]
MVVSAEQITIIPKELSWLDFNARVLQEAADESVPLIQRVRYLGIFSNNMDEYFRVQVADVRRLALFSSPAQRAPYIELLDQIRSKVLALQANFDAIYYDLLCRLRDDNIYVINETQLDQVQGAFVRDYFTTHVESELAPVLLDERNDFPPVVEGSIHFAIKLDTSKGLKYVLLEIPTQRLGRFILIPQPDGKRRKVVIVIDNIIRYCLVDIFKGVFQINSAEAYTIKFTRDAELELSSSISQSFVDKVSQSLKKRRKAALVRFVYDEAMPNDMLNMLSKKLGFGKYDSFIPGGRYHNSKDFMDFPNLGGKSLEFKAQPPVLMPELEENRNLFECLKEKDLLFFFPYHSFNYVTQFVKVSALDPAVKSIYICLYRVAEHSLIVHALLNAVKNKKEVTVVVELQARFDEQANIRWANRLMDEGVNVIFGVSGLKVHNKIIRVVRKEGGSTRTYSYVGTGNFNEKTARLYSDFGLLTANQEIGDDLEKVFDFIKYTYRHYEYKHLWVAPHSLRSKITGLIEQEIIHAQNGLDAQIFIKCNNLEDQTIIDKLYEAGRAGVNVRLMVRGVCCMLAGVPGVSESVEVKSLVDRYLEHSRVYVFGAQGAEQVFISSADLMTRNLDFRVEVACPIYEQELKAKVLHIMELQWNDNVKARSLGETDFNQVLVPEGARKLRSQEQIHRYLSKFS